MKKPKRTVAENKEIILIWKEVQAFALANPALDKEGKPLPNPLVDALDQVKLPGAALHLPGAQCHKAQKQHQRAQRPAPVKHSPGGDVDEDSR